MSVCIPFSSLDVDGLERLIRSESCNVHKWALYVRRGPRQKVELRDGLSIQIRSICAGPVSPYSGFLFLRSGAAIDDEREQMIRDEVNVLGTHNIVVRLAGHDKDIPSSVRIALRE